MHDSEQEHSSITGCRVTYESTIFYNEANKFSIIVVKTSDPRIPPQACNGRYYGDRMLRFTAVGYELPRTKAVELELDGEWVESKYGYQLQVEQWQEIVPQTADGLLAYLGSGLIKGIGPKTAEDIVATFGPDTLNILDNEPEKLLQIVILVSAAKDNIPGRHIDFRRRGGLCGFSRMGRFFAQQMGNNQQHRDEK